MRRFKKILLASSAASLSLMAAFPALAAPEGGTVIGGSANIAQHGKKTDIYQSSNKAIIDWRSFDIAPDEHTQFHQPSSSAIALNRIKDTKASRIDGKLTANGHVMLINPNGIVFGAGSQVDVGALTASTADIDNDDFMAGKLDFNKAGAPDAEIINKGNITAGEAGLVNLVAPKVENQGIITAKLGKVQLAAADTFTLDMAGDGLIQVAITDEDASKLARNKGIISAEGGYVAITAAKARNFVDSLVENSGIIEASSMTSQGGKIILSAHQGTTNVSGTLKAGGAKGGGEILIGGDYQGQNGSVKNSKDTVIEQGTVIDASATDIGDGGKVIVWADENARYAGQVTAQGGINGGNGGFVETSGKANLHVAEGSNVNASARHADGTAGSWLLDPSNVIITNGSGNNIPGGGGTVNPGTDGYTINAASITAALNSGNNVTITTTNGGGTQDGDINVTSATISKTATNNNVTLTLQAVRNITVENSTITSSANALNVVLNADRDANQIGSVRIDNSTITTNGGNFVAGGGSGTLGGTNGILGDGDGTGADDVAAWGNNAQVSSESLYAAGVGLYNSSIITNNGGIYIKGRGYANSELTQNGKSAVGVRLRTSHLQTTGGKINVSGTGGGQSGSALNMGIYFLDTSTITSVGGDITLYGKGGFSATSDSHGVALSSTSINKITTTTGHVQLSGEVVDASSNSLHVRSSSTADGGIFSLGSGRISLQTLNGRLNTLTATLGGNSATGDITFITDTINLGTDSNIKTSGAVYVKPVSANRTIGIGGGTGDLNLTDLELEYFNGTGKLVIGDSATGTGDIDLDSWDLSSKLFSGVEIYGNDIDIGGLTMGTGSFLAYAKDNGGDVGDVTISANITRNANGDATLDLRADRNVETSNGADIIATDANSDADNNPATSPDRLNVILNADRNGNNSGAVSLNDSTVTTLGGYFVAGGGSGVVGGVNGILGDGDGTGADDVMAWGHSSRVAGVTLTTAASISTGAGSIILNGHGYDNSATTAHHGVNLTSSSLYSTSGDIRIRAKGGESTNNAYGVHMNGSTISTATGNIKLVGSGGASVGNDAAIVVFSSSVIEATDSGSIELTGTDSVTNGNLSIGSAGANRIGNATMTGNIRINANTISFSDTDDTILTQGDIIVKATTASTSIGLGGGSGDLNLTDAELGTFNGTGKLIIGDSAAGTGDIDLDSWNWSGKLFSGIEIYGNDIDIGGLTMGRGNFFAYAKDAVGDVADLRISDDITRGVDGVATLELRADHHITNSTNADIIASDANSDGDGDAKTDADLLHVILNADRNAGNDGGAISFNNGNIYSNGGNIKLGGGSGVISAGSGFAKSSASGLFNGIYLGGGTSAIIDAQGGNVVINGDANAYFTGVAIDATARVRTSGTGTIDIYGIGGSASGSTRGIQTSAGSVISNNGGTGAININGRTTTSLGSGNDGVSLLGSISSGGMVNITGLTSRNGHGVFLGAAGTITITGPSGGLSMTGTAHGASSTYNGINFSTHATNSVGIESGDITLTSLVGDIVLDKAIKKTGTGVSTLSMKTPSNIVLTGNADITATNGSLNVVLNADRDANQSGAITLTNTSVVTRGGYFVAGGGSGTLGGVDGILGNGDGTGADDVAAWGNSAYAAGVQLTSSSVNTAAGNIYMKGNGDINSVVTDADLSAAGIRLRTSSLTSTNSGSINLQGIAGGASGSNTNDGVFLRGGSTIQSAAGDINIYGKGGPFGTNAHGVGFSGSGMNTITTDAGHIDIEGEVIDTSQPAIYLATPNGGIYSGNGGRITLTALNSSITGTQAFTIGGNTATGNIILNTDALALATGSAVRTTGDIYVTPQTTSTTIGLGTGAGDLNLTDAELDMFYVGGKLVIGDNSAGNGNVAINGVTVGTGGYGLEIYGNNITVNNGGLAAGPSLTMIAQGNIALNGVLSSNGTGNSVVLVGDSLTNTAGASAINPGAGRYLVYMDNPSDVIKGGLTAGALYNRSYGSNAPGTINTSFGNRFVYVYQPTLTITADNLTLANYDPAYTGYTYTVSGLEPGDIASDAFTGTPSYATSALSPSTYNIVPSTGTGSSPIGYALNFASGVLTVQNVNNNPPAPTPPAPTPATPVANGPAQLPAASVIEYYSKILQAPENVISNTLQEPQQKTEHAMSDGVTLKVGLSKNTEVASANLIEIEEPLLEFYDLCSYNETYCK